MQQNFTKFTGEKHLVTAEHSKNDLVSGANFAFALDYRIPQACE